MNRWTGTALAVVLASGLAGPAQAEKVLRTSLQLPMSHHLGRNLLDFKQVVERETDGAVRIEVYSSAVFYKDDEVHRAVADGAIEMGVASLTELAEIVPAVDLFSLPFLFSDSAAVKKATRPGSPIRGPLDAAILKTGTRVLWWQAFGGTILLSRGKPIVSPGDVKGRRMRVFGKTVGDYIEALGGTVVHTAGSQQYGAYVRSIVDSGMTGVTAVVSRALYDVMPHLTVTNNADVEFVVLINEGVWQDLTEAQRSVLTQASRRVEFDLREKMDRLEAEALEIVRGKMNVVDLDAAGRDAWRGSGRSVVDTYLERAGALGARLVEAARALR